MNRMSMYDAQNVILGMNLEVVWMEKIDVLIPTLKKEEAFQDCINSIYDSIPVNRILLDDSSEGRATARTKLMQQVETEYFAFIDDDIILNKKWFKKVSETIEADRTIGACNGLGLTNNFLLNIIRKTLMFVRGIDEQRGFTSNTIFRTEATKGVVLNDNDRFEDLQLQKIIKDRGWKWKTVRAYCKHTKSGKVVFKEAWKDFKRLVKEHGLIKGVMKI